MTEQHTIQIDHKTRAIRDGNQWAVQRSDRDGVYDTQKIWTGNRRSLLRYLDDNKIYPTREALEQIDALPERTGFRQDDQT